MDVVAEHVVIAGDVGRLIAPGQLCADDQQNGPAANDRHHCAERELVVANSLLFIRKNSAGVILPKPYLYVIRWGEVSCRCATTFVDWHDVVCSAAASRVSLEHCLRN